MASNATPVTAERGMARPCATPARRLVRKHEPASAPAYAGGQQIRANAGADGHSPDERRCAGTFPIARAHLRPDDRIAFGCRLALKPVPPQPGFTALRRSSAARPASFAPGPPRHPHGRHRPRKRGRPDRRRRQADRARHGPADPRRQRHRLPVPARRNPRPPGTAPDGPAQPEPLRHRLPRFHRSARRRQHRRIRR
ncbi:hypothetical protein G6F59_014545 [Rhizopus arrhizus]|nr:hypothetical protein G6F59_014545 [Rhizopus arrhizus]